MKGYYRQNDLWSLWHFTFHLTVLFCFAFLKGEIYMPYRWASGVQTCVNIAYLCSQIWKDPCAMHIPPEVSKPSQSLSLRNLLSPHLHSMKKALLSQYYRKGRHRELEWLAQAYTACWWWSCDLNPWAQQGYSIWALTTLQTGFENLRYWFHKGSYVWTRCWRVSFPGWNGVGGARLDFRVLDKAACIWGMKYLSKVGGMG